MGCPISTRGMTIRWCSVLVLVMAVGAGPVHPAPEVAPTGEPPLTTKHRVVLLECYELAACLGAWDRVVGISHYAYDNDLLQRMVPQLRQIPSPGSGFDINTEALLALKPDLVVTWSRKPETVAYLNRKGLEVLPLYPENVADIRRDLLLLGQVLGKAERAREVLALMQAELDKIQQRVRSIPKESPRVVWLWGKPTTINGNKGVVHDLMTLARGRNLGEFIDGFNRELSMEEIVALNPEVVLIWGSASYGPEDLKNDPKWQTIQAVKDGRVYKATRASTWSPRIVELAWWMAQKFYPQDISPAEAEAALSRFYPACFGIPYERRP